MRQSFSISFLLLLFFTLVIDCTVRLVVGSTRSDRLSNWLVGYTAKRHWLTTHRMKNNFMFVDCLCKHWEVTLLHFIICWNWKLVGGITIPLYGVYGRWTNLFVCLLGLHCICLVTSLDCHNSLIFIFFGLLCSWNEIGAPIR